MNRLYAEKKISYFYMFCDWNICDIFQTIICQSFCNRSGLEHIYLFVCFFDAERQIFTVLDRCIQLLCTRFRTNQMLYACCKCLKLWLKPESNITFDRLFVHCLSIMHLSLWLWLKSWLETIFIEMLYWMRWFQGNWCTAQFYFFCNKLLHKLCSLQIFRPFWIPFKLCTNILIDNFSCIDFNSQMLCVKFNSNKASIQKKKV